MLKGEEMNQRLLKSVCAGIGWLALILTLLAGSAPVAAQESKSLVRLHIPGYSPNSLPFQIAEDKGYYKVIIGRTGSAYRLYG
jgi:ABC-type nitrate/sulfonate/bicarbonate transport system substrate-binding protein